MPEQLSYGGICLSVSIFLYCILGLSRADPLLSKYACLVVTSRHGSSSQRTVSVRAGQIIND